MSIPLKCKLHTFQFKNEESIDFQRFRQETVLGSRVYLLLTL